MPSTRRCVFGCDTTGVTIHSFPNPNKFQERFRIWVGLADTSVSGMSDTQIYNNRRVCDKHFTEKDKNRNSRLNAIAIPHLHIPKTSTPVASTGGTDLRSESPSTSVELSGAASPSTQEEFDVCDNPVPTTSIASLASAIEGVIAVDRALDVSFGDGKSIRFEDCWLRDHCRCSSCYHSNTFQRAHHILDIPDVKVLAFENDLTKIEVTWSDSHKSTYTAEFLSKFDYKTWKESRKLKPILWHGPIDNKIPKVPVGEFLTSVKGAQRVFQSLLDYGVALVEGVSVSLDATEVVCEALGGVQYTIFGGMWQFTTRADHADTAYTNLPLAAHNDNTYFTEAAGLQILHCLEHKNGTGGETILVDGFFGAQELKKENPEDFKFLSTFNLEAEYIEDGHHHTYSAPVIRVDKETEELVQIRFNVYDRAPMAFSNSEECRSYYRSLRSLAKYYQDPSNQWRFKLTPGTVMIMDNFRVLHGRTGFSGSRVLGGSYVARSDWLDKARALGLIK